MVRIRSSAAYKLLMNRAGRPLQAVVEAGLIGKAELWRMFTGLLGPNVDAVSYATFVRELDRWAANCPPLGPDERFALATEFLNADKRPAASERGGESPVLRRRRGESSTAPQSAPAPAGGVARSKSGQRPDDALEAATGARQLKSLEQLARERRKGKLHRLEAELGFTSRPEPSGEPQTSGGQASQSSRRRPRTPPRPPRARKGSASAGA